MWKGFQADVSNEIACRAPEPLPRMQGLGVLTGLLGAAIAAISYGAATILQTLGVRRLAAVGQRAPLTARMLAGRLYATGLALDGVGFAASVAALRQLPLFLVEAAVASSVAVTAALAVLVLDVRLSGTEVIGLGVTILGLVLLAVGAKPGPGKHLGSGAGILLLASAAVVAIVVWIGVRDHAAGRATVALASASGLGFGLVGIAARTLHVPDPWWHTVTDPALWAIVANGVVASVAYGFALHRGRTTTVAAITFSVETVIPAIVGLALLGDGVRAGFVPVAALGFLAALGGSITLAGYAGSPTAEPTAQSR